MKGIDVSSHQGTIDWKKVKPQIDFAIIRCGYGDDLTSQDDKEFFNNVSGCITNNISFGIYLYSYAKNLVGTESIQSEINHCKRLLSQIPKAPFCVYIDIEDNSRISLGKKVLTDYAQEFCYQITNMGYKAGVYANEHWFNNYLDTISIANLGYSLWCAKFGTDKPIIDSSYDIWQYSNTGLIDGINGNVDMDNMINDIINERTENSPQVNVYYKVKTKDYGWLPEVENLKDYAGWNNNPITAIAIKVDQGTIKYRVHLKGKNWLNYVTGYNINEIINGYAGNGNDIIDAIEVYYYTPSNIRPYQKAKYRINDYSWQYDNETTNGQDGYAGKLGINATKFQIIIM